MCYSGRCKYETYYGECGLPCGATPPNDAVCATMERRGNMKFLNKQKKLKRSKMFIDKNVYEKICQRYGKTLKEHLAILDKAIVDPYFIPDMIDLSIMFEVYNSITKIIRER